MNAVNSRPYHHGNLREELIRIAVSLAAEGGPDAVVLREAARRAGVSPSAAYRHFRGQAELQTAVHDAASGALREYMERALAGLDPSAAPPQRLEAAGHGYFAFGMEQPELFQAFSRKDPIEPEGPQPRPEGPFDLLRSLVADARPDATEDQVFTLAVGLWASVHGITTLCAGGILRQLPAARKRNLMEQTIAAPIRTITTVPGD